MLYSDLAQKGNLKFNSCVPVIPKAYGSDHSPF